MYCSCIVAVFEDEMKLDVHTNVKLINVRKKKTTHTHTFLSHPILYKLYDMHGSIVVYFRIIKWVQYKQISDLNLEKQCILL